MRTPTILNFCKNTAGMGLALGRYPPALKIPFQRKCRSARSPTIFSSQLPIPNSRRALPLLFNHRELPYPLARLNWSLRQRSARSKAATRLTVLFGGAWSHGLSCIRLNGRRRTRKGKLRERPRRKTSSLLHGLLIISLLVSSSIALRLRNLIFIALATLAYGTGATTSVSYFH